MSFIGQQTNQQSLNGIIDLTDGTISIVDGDISNVKSLSINGEINMNTNKIIALQDGTNPGDAVNKAQLDAVSLNLIDYVRRDGTNSMTGNLNLANNKMINVATPTNGTDATNKDYIDNNFVKLTGNQTIAGLKTFSSDVNLSSKKIVNLADGTSLGDAINFTQLTAVNNSLSSIQTNYLKRDGTLSMTGQLTSNFTNASLDIRTTDENQDAILYLSTPYQNGTTNRRKTAIIADGISNWNRANLHFCLNQQLNHDGVVSVSDSRMCILNGGNVGIGTTTPSEKLDVNGNTKIRGILDVSSNKIINLTTPTTGTDATNKDYVDTQTNNTNYLLRNGTLSMTGNLNINNYNVNNVANPTTGTDATNKNYVDTHSNNSNYLLRNGTLPMTGNLNLNNKYINNLPIPENGTDASNKNYVDNVSTAMRDYVDDSLNLKVDREGDTMTGILTINKDANNPLTLSSSSSSFNFISGQTIYDVYNLSSSNITIYLPPKGSTDTTLNNREIFFNFPSSVNITFLPYGGGSGVFNLSGSDFTSLSILFISKYMKLSCTSTTGFYIKWTYANTLDNNQDQLTLQSNLGISTNTEYTGIKFLNTNTEAGLLRVETDRYHNNSVMRFYTRSDNNIILPLDVGTTIDAYKPIIRNAWTSGELIKTTIFSRATTGVSKVANVNPNTGLDWLYPTLTLRNTPTNSIIVMNFDAPYHFTGAAADTLELYVYDTTGGTANLVFAKSQYYDAAGGGGTRSGPIFPFSFSHTPSQATSTATRTYMITLYSRSATDILRLCQGVFNGSVINLDYYTCEMREIKI